VFPEKAVPVSDPRLPVRSLRVVLLVFVIVVEFLVSMVVDVAFEK
jgi:hypothetical protein